MTENVQLRERVPLWLCFILIFLISWPGAIPMILASYGKTLSAPVKLLQILMLFGPAIAVCLASWINSGWIGVKQLLRGLVIWRVSIGWYFLALLVPLLIYAASLLFSNMSGQTNTRLPAPDKWAPTFFMTLGVYLLLNTEEIAWRGYVLPRLQKHFGVFIAALVIGLIWTVFHLPLFWMKGGHPAGYPFWLFTVMVFCITFLFSAAYNGTSGSVLIVHLLHQGLNAAVEAIPVYPKAVHSILPMCLASAAFLLIALFLLLKVKKEGRVLDPPLKVQY